MRSNSYENNILNKQFILETYGIFGILYTVNKNININN